MTNVAIVVLDTLRLDTFNQHFQWVPGRRFEKAYTTSHWTTPVHATLFTGRYATELGVHAKSPALNCPEPTLSELLGEEGYTTRAFSANPNISRAFSFDRGFDEFGGSWRVRHFNSDEYFNWNQYNREEGSNDFGRHLRGLLDCLQSDCATWPSLKQGIAKKFGTRIDDGASTAVEKIRDIDFREHEFLFVNLMEAHHPYEAPESYQTVEPPGFVGLSHTLADESIDPEQIRTAYEDCSRYLSDIYHDLFDELRKSFDYIITLSDHGELFGEHGVWKHRYGLFPELTHIPLVVWGEDMPDDAVTETVSLLDVFRTVTDMCDIDPPSKTYGRSLLSVEAKKRPAYLTEYHGLSSEIITSLLEDGHHHSAVEAHDTELFGLAMDSYYGYETIEGFNEEGTLPTSNPHEKLNERVKTLDKRAVDASEAGLSAAERDQLQALGYM